MPVSLYIHICYIICFSPLELIKSNSHVKPPATQAAEWNPELGRVPVWFVLVSLAATVAGILATVEIEVFQLAA